MMKKRAAFLFCVPALALAGCGQDGKIPIKVPLLPKFEVGELPGDFPGEAQLYFEACLAGGQSYHDRRRDTRASRPVVSMRREKQKARPRAAGNRSN